MLSKRDRTIHYIPYDSVYMIDLKAKLYRDLNQVQDSRDGDVEEGSDDKRELFVLGVMEISIFCLW